MKKFGLIGKKLSHSFSKAYFSKKFEDLGLRDHRYDLFELESIEAIRPLLQKPHLTGLNVTVPYKEAVIPYLDGLDETAKNVGAVNVIKITDGKTTGYNSDYLGFRQSLAGWLPSDFASAAAILGSGGAAKAVAAVLEKRGIRFSVVSRNPDNRRIAYSEVMKNKAIKLIINTTPLGMSPDVGTFPPIDYSLLSADHYLYDLVYNPDITAFLRHGMEKGAKTKNGLEMLHFQAEAAWDIWSES